MNTSLPVLFVSHGAPMFAIEPGQAGEQLAKLGRELTQPRAIVVISPHWMTRGEVCVTASPHPETIHDFGGFPDALYELQYPAPGAPPLAQEIVDLLNDAGWKARLDARRGLDHGAWVPLLYLAPEASTPVIQVSMPMPIDTHSALRLGQALKPLRDMNVLIVASGSLTHNLYEFRGASTHGEAYVKQFAAWTAQALTAGDTAQVLDYRRLAPAAERAHPTDEHFLPLLIALGAAGKPTRHGFWRVASPTVYWRWTVIFSTRWHKRAPSRLSSTEAMPTMRDTTFSDPAREPGTGLIFRKACTATAPKGRLILLHGVGSNEANLASLAASLPEELEVILLRGPLQLSPQGFAWFQVTFTNDGPRTMKCRRRRAVNFSCASLMPSPRCRL